MYYWGYGALSCRAPITSWKQPVPRSLTTCRISDGLPDHRRRQFFFFGGGEPEDNGRQKLMYPLRKLTWLAGKSIIWRCISNWDLISIWRYAPVQGVHVVGRDHSPICLHWKWRCPLPSSFRVYNPYLGVQRHWLSKMKYLFCCLVISVLDSTMGSHQFAPPFGEICCIFSNHQTSKSKSIECYLFSYDIPFLSQPQVAAPLNTENKIYSIFQRVWIET